MSTAKKSEGFAFTDYLMNESFFQELTKDPTVKYLIVGKEVCPNTGRVHGQGYVHYKNARSFNAIKNLFAPRHVEPALASAFKNKKYCEKEGNLLLEYGDLPIKGKRSDIKELISLIEEGKTLSNLAKTHPTAVLRMSKGIENLRNALQPKRNWKSEVIVNWGEPGVGKTWKAVNEEKGEIISYDGKYFNNYENQEVVILDDFNPQDWRKEGDRELLLHLLDAYAFKVRVLYGTCEWNPKKIVITSNYDPQTWWADDKMSQKALLRRLDVVEEIVDDSKDRKFAMWKGIVSHVSETNFEYWKRVNEESLKADEEEDVYRTP